MPNFFDDYISSYFKPQQNEIGFRLGIPIIAYEINKTPPYKVTNTKYNKIEVHDIRFRSIGADGINLAISMRWERFTNRPILGGVIKTGETNADANAYVRLKVSSAHQVEKAEPLITGVSSSSSGFDLGAICDYMFSGFTSLMSGGRSSFTFTNAVLGLGAMPYNFGAFLRDWTAITPEMRLKLKQVIILSTT